MAEALDRELARAYDWFEADTTTMEGNRWRAFSGIEREWRRSAPLPRLFRAWYVVHDDGAGGLTLRRFDPVSRLLPRVDWPDELASIRAAIEAEDRYRRARAPGIYGFEPHVGPEVDDPAALMIPMFTADQAAAVGAGPAYGYELGLLDLDYLRTSVLPGLARSYLGDEDGLEFEIDVVRARDPAEVVMAAPHPGPPDVEVATFHIGFAHLDDMFISRDDHMPEDGLWRLRARHRDGSIAAHVHRAWLRDVAAGVAALLVLIASVALLVASARRARNLASQQLTFVAGITHELRTPLAVIRSAAENLADGLVTEPARVQRYGALLVGEGRRLSRMVEHTIAFAALEGGRPVADEIYDVAAVLAELDVRDDLVVRFSDALPALRGDPDATRQVIDNLVENARKHAPGAAIAIDVESVAGPDGPALRIEVADQGDGIDAADVPHLFDPFFRGRRARDGQVPGSGLGLSVVKRLVEAQHGTVAVRSQPGAGSTFIVHLPVAA
jgi:signal transduction histidine kinase